MFESVVYPFLGWQEETRLFERNLANERDFLDDAESPETSARIKAARERVPHRTGEIPGLRDPNERMDKGLAKTLAYRFLANESVVSRNVAKRGSTQWGRDASAFHRKWHEELESALDDFGLTSRLKRVEHHVSHAANAYYTSGFDEALIVTLDGYGSGLAGSISIGRDGAIERVHGLQYPHSLGTFYESVTSALGFQPSRHEGKIVGLAAYGDPAVLRDVLLSRFAQEDGNFRILESNNVYFSRLLASQFPKIDVAAAYQHVLERVACNYVCHYMRKTGLKNLVLSGGVVANVKLNQRLKEIAGRRAHLHPPEHGRRRLRHRRGAARVRRQRRGTQAVEATRGRVSSGQRLRRTRSPTRSRARSLPFTKYTPIEPKIAALIAAGKVVARFNGRMEYGPRALGNRSILYHAKEPAVNQWLNQRLGRTEFMPFAPATLFEKRDECYRNVDGRRARRVVHDADLRLHRVDEARLAGRRARRRHGAAAAGERDVEPELPQASSTEYHQLTGIPSLINTSFNMHEEPIVCSPDDAIRAFLQGNLDYLAIGDFLVAHPSARR